MGYQSRSGWCLASVPVVWGRIPHQSATAARLACVAVATTPGFPALRPRTSTTSSPTPPRSLLAKPCQKGSRPQPAPRTLRMTAPRDALSHDF